jgi:hypothetical protein
MPQAEREGTTHEPGIFREEPIPGLVVYEMYDLSGKWMAESRMRLDIATPLTEERLKAFYLLYNQPPDPKEGDHLRFLRLA